MQLEPPLQPLRIPGGWYVAYNCWVIADPASPDSLDFLQEDLLQLTHERCDLLVDVGWYGRYGQVADGEFGAVVRRGDFCGPELAAFRSRSLVEVVEVVETWLRNPFSFRDPQP
jgi:hypothetical protein